MPAYRVLKPYRSSGAQLPTPGAIVELEAGLAAWVERDSPGTLIPHTEPEAVEAKAPAAPTHDRMAHAPRRRGPRKDGHDA